MKFTDALLYVLDNSATDKIDVDGLRKGNWVKRESQPDGFMIEDFSLERIRQGASDYKPIPITKKWLERLGLRKLFTVPDSYEFDIHKYWIYNIRNKCVYNAIGLINDPVNEKPIIYVHQLQNIYYHYENVMIKRVK